MDEEEDDNGDISIHALREEGDRVPGYRTHHHPISIHALREEGDLHSGVVREGSSRISIHALREEGDGASERGCDTMTISIHALREEGDVPAYQLAGEDTNFYPRPPRGERPTLRSGS